MRFQGMIWIRVIDNQTSSYLILCHLLACLYQPVYPAVVKFDSSVIGFTSVVNLCEEGTKYACKLLIIAHGFASL